MKAEPGPESDLFNHRQLPMVDHIRSLRERDVTTYLSIGHKLGAAVDPEIDELLGHAFFASNTWLNGDDYHEALFQAERLGADAWGAARSFYLVDGSSSGNHAFFLATLGPGDKVIVARDLHWSMLVSIILTGAEPIYVAPRLHPLLDIGLGVFAEEVEETLELHPEAKLVAIVSPSFCGVATDIEAIAQSAHVRGIPLYVDEAWGPHFQFHPTLPKSALSSGADAVVGSVHKLLPAVSQGSVLHVNSELLDIERIETAVRMMQTTSPLLPILATIDGARRQMMLAGESMLGQAIDLARQVRERVSAIDGIEIIDAAALGIQDQRFDSMKLVLDVRGLGVTGFEVERILNEHHAIAVELSDFRGIIGNINCGDTQASIDRLVHALVELSKSDRIVSLQTGGQSRSSGSAVTISTQVLSPRDAYFARSESVDMRDAENEIAAELITPYPPGIPVLAPGELITSEKIDYLLATGIHGRGNYGASGDVPIRIKVVRDPRVQYGKREELSIGVK